MAPAVFGRLERRRCRRVASRPLLPLSLISATAALALATATAGSTTAQTFEMSVRRPAIAPDGGFTRAVRTGPAWPTAAPEPPAPPSTVETTASDARAILDLTNDARARSGLGPVQLDAGLEAAARAHAADQFDRGCSKLSHTGTDGSSPFDRILRTGYRYRTAAENIACGYAGPGDVMNGWMTSSGHRANILNGSVTHVGISATRDAWGNTYWVQVFAAPR